jgi:hypothetical protein
MCADEDYLDDIRRDYGIILNPETGNRAEWDEEQQRWVDTVTGKFCEIDD